MGSSNVFSRKQMLERIGLSQTWDVLVIGGGATGLGIALDSATRGYSTLLLEQHDFAKSTSSRSTKLIHGGVRYLAQGNISLVYEALYERAILLKNAPHVVKPLAFIIPCYNYADTIKYLAGLKFYDLLSGTHSFGRSVFLRKEEVLDKLPNINPKRLKGGVQYFDGQFDDARLAVNIAQTAAEHGAAVLNYVKVTGLKKNNGKVSGVNATDVLSGISLDISARSVINATGIFVDDIMKMDDPNKKPVVTTSQGAHIVINKSFLDAPTALMIPKTSDGRVIFAVPWHGHLLVGTTDNLLKPPDPLEPVALEKEIGFLLEGIADFLVRAPSTKDVLSVFAGLRPLAAPSDHKRSTKEISRSHKLITSVSGLVTITGGKWTTYRKMAEDAVDSAAKISSLLSKKCLTENISLHGAARSSSAGYSSIYGTDEKEIEKLIAADPSLKNKLVEGHPYTRAEIMWAVRNEMAMTVEDVLARRLRLLFLDARAALAAAPEVADLMMKELNLTEEWKQQQLTAFNRHALQYTIN